MAIVEFVVPGRPRGKGAVTTTRWGGYLPKTTTKEMEAFRYIGLAAMRGRPPMTGPLKVQMVAVFAVPTAFNRAIRAKALVGEMAPTNKPDADNISKLIGDAMSGVVYVDDAQIVRLLITKKYGLTPAVHVRVEEIEGTKRHDTQSQKPGSTGASLLPFS